MTDRTWVNGSGIALSATNLNGMEADITAALGVPDAALAGRVVAGATKAALDLAYIGRWKPNTAYTAGQQVALPDNQIGSAKANFTSGASYDSTKWTLLTALDLLNSATSAAEVIQRIQYMTNPSGEPTTTGWAMNNSGGASTISSWNGAAPGAGAASYRATITTTPTGAGLGPKITNPVGTVPGLSGDKVSCGIWVHSSVACNMFVSLAVFSGATQGTGQNGPTVAVPANVWTQLKIENTFTAGANYDNVRIWPQVATADVSKFTPGSTLSYDAAQFERTATLGPWFDGNTAASGNLTYRWAGTPGASVSYQMANDTLVRRSATGSVQVGAPATGADAVNRAYLESQGHYNVLNEGAKGDATDAGGTDDTAAFQAAFDKARGSFGFGGTVEVPPRAYKLDGSVKTYSNVRAIGYGAVLRKYSTNTTYSVFETLSNGATGYGSGGSNITFEGFTFQGVFGTGSTGIAVTLHHAENVTFRKCTWTEAIISGHAIDLLGCKGVLVDDCVFKGFKVTANREYVEAIQCDYSMNGAGGSESNVASWDGLPTINVTVRNSKFLPLANAADATKPWAAPNPLGSHSRLDGKWIENIKFLDNYVEGGIATDSTAITDGFAVLTRGWIHFFCARNIEISGNTFKNTRKYQDAAVTDPTKVNTFGKPVAARVLMCYPISTGTLMADIQNASAASQSMTPMPVENLVMERNTFDGFNSDGVEEIINVRGTLNNKARDVSLIKNRFVNCWSTPGTPGDKGQDALYIQDAVGVTLRDNDVQYARGLVYAYRVAILNILGGTLQDIGMYAGRFSECSDVTIDNVHARNFGCMWYSYNNGVLDSSSTPQVATAGFEIRGGSIVQGYSAAQVAALPGPAAQPITLSGVSDFYISNTRAPYSSTANYTQLIYIYSTPSNGRVEDLRAKGWNAQTQVSAAVGILKGTGTGVVSQNNLL